MGQSLCRTGLPRNLWWCCWWLPGRTYLGWHLIKSGLQAQSESDRVPDWSMRALIAPLHRARVGTRGRERERYIVGNKTVRDKHLYTCVPWYLSPCLPMIPSTMALHTVAIGVVVIVIAVVEIILLVVVVVSNRNAMYDCYSASIVPIQWSWQNAYMLVQMVPTVQDVYVQAMHGVLWRYVCGAGGNHFIDTLLSIASLYMACMYCMYSL